MAAMAAAFLRLFLIGLAVILVFVFTLFGLRWVGSLREFEAFDHPLIKENKLFWVVAKGGGAERHQAYTETAIKAALALDKNLGLELPLRRSSDGVWFVFPSYRLEEMTEAQGPPEVFTWDQLSKLDAGYHTIPGSRLASHQQEDSALYRGQAYRLLTLEEVVALAPRRLLILTFFDPRASYVEEVAQLIESLQIDKEIILRSPFSKFIRELRKIKPMWLYGSDSPGMGRAKVLDSLGIETLISFQEDIVITGLTLNGSMILSDSLLDEISRQKRRLLLEFEFEEGPSRYPIPSERLRTQLDGVITSRPSWALQEFRQGAP